MEDYIDPKVEKLKNLILTVDSPNKGAMLDLVYEIEQVSKRRRRILELVQEALSQLRLDMKYIAFDLEATRRERDALKKDQ